MKTRIVYAQYANCSCKDCTDRYVGCHSSCQKYASFKDEMRNKSILKDQYKSMEYDANSHAYNARRRFSKYHFK